MMKYEPFKMLVIRLEEDCIRTSTSDFKDYDENELPLVPFIQG